MMGNRDEGDAGVAALSQSIEVNHDDFQGHERQAK